MPNRDPSFWQSLAAFIPHTLVALTTFAMAFLRVLHDGGKRRRALIEAAMCTLLALPLYPVFLWLADASGLPTAAALPPCTFIGALGMVWLRDKANDTYEVFIGRWRK